MARIDTWYNAHPGVWTLAFFAISSVLALVGIASIFYGPKWKRALIDERQKRSQQRLVEGLKWKKSVIVLANHGDNFAFIAMIYDVLRFFRTSILIFICVRMAFAVLAAIQFTSKFGLVNAALVGLDKGVAIGFEAVLAFTMWKLLDAIRLLDAIFSDQKSIARINSQLELLGVTPSLSTESPADTKDGSA